MLHLSMIPFGQAVMMWRVARGLTQAQLAITARVPRPNLSDIERGSRDVSLRTVRALAAALTVNPGALVDGHLPEPAFTLSFGRPQLERIAYAAVHGKTLSNPEENTIASEIRQLARPRLEAAGVVFASAKRGRLTQVRKSLSIRHRLPVNVFKSLLDRMSDEASRDRR